MNVNFMLMVDKIQNCKDYNIYQETNKKLELYFCQWLVALGIGDGMYRDGIHIITKGANKDEN